MEKVKVNLSEKIREHLKSLKPSERSPKAVSEALAEKGFKVSPTLVAVIKGRMEGKKAIKVKAKANTRSKGKAKPKAVRQPSNMDNLIHAKNFLKAVGGVKEAKGLLDLVSSLIS
jgi:hypothetical protein